MTERKRTGLGEKIEGLMISGVGIYLLRVSRLVVRLEQLKKTSCVGGESKCAVCGERLGLLSRPSTVCKGCGKVWSVCLSVCESVCLSVSLSVCL